MEVISPEAHKRLIEMAFHVHSSKGIITTQNL